MWPRRSLLLLRCSSAMGLRTLLTPDHNHIHPIAGHGGSRGQAVAAIDELVGGGAWVPCGNGVLWGRDTQLVVVVRVTDTPLETRTFRATFGGAAGTIGMAQPLPGCATITCVPIFGSPDPATVLFMGTLARAAAGVKVIPDGFLAGTNPAWCMPEHATTAVRGISGGSVGGSDPVRMWASGAGWTADTNNWGKPVLDEDHRLIGMQCQALTAGARAGAVVFIKPSAMVALIGHAHASMLAGMGLGGGVGGGGGAGGGSS
jgi:hypothetical protein